MKRIVFAVLALIILIPALGLAYWLISPYFLDDEVNEEFLYSVSATIPEDMTQEEAEKEMVEAAEAQPVEVKDDMPEAMKDMPEEEKTAMLVVQGNFQDQDSVHKGSGQAFIFKLPDGSHVLRFENFNVTNGPDLHVLVSTDGSPSNATDLGQLKGNVGNQNYEIPASVDVSTLQTVIIYCDPFRVVFSTAQLTPPV